MACCLFPTVSLLPIALAPLPARLLHGLLHGCATSTTVVLVAFLLPVDLAAAGTLVQRLVAWLRQLLTPGLACLFSTFKTPAYRPGPSASTLVEYLFAWL